MKQTVECSVYREKMVDYQKFAFILLCLGVFLFLGTIISIDRGIMEPRIEMLFTFSVLNASFSLFCVSLKYKSKLMCNEEHIS